VLFPGGGKIRWQQKRTDQELWDYDFTPSDEDWQSLEENMEARYRRRNVPLKNLELVRELRNKKGTLARPPSASPKNIVTIPDG
jgi:hypothetical protein